MPTVKNITGPYRFSFYSFDCNEPIHDMLNEIGWSLSFVYNRLKSSEVGLEGRMKEYYFKEV